MSFHVFTLIVGTFWNCVSMYCMFIVFVGNFKMSDLNINKLMFYCGNNYILGVQDLIKYYFLWVPFGFVFPCIYLLIVFVGNFKMAT